MRKILIGVFLIIIGARGWGADAVPVRIVSLAPSYDETLIELGLQCRLVGVTTASDYLAEVRGVERVGSWIAPNIEKIIALRPDLVLAVAFTGQQMVVKQLSALGFRAAVMDDTRGLDEIFAKTKELGDILGERARTAELLERMRRVVDRTRRRTAALTVRPRVYVEVGSDPLVTCGKDSFINDLIEIAGGKNIAGEIDQSFPRISAEFIVRQDPEVVILPYMDRKLGQTTVKQRLGWTNISGIRHGRIYDDIGLNLITIPSPRLILYGLPELLKRIHPGIMAGEAEE